jgi:cell wall-associated NlpC family hydrolase
MSKPEHDDVLETLTTVDEASQVIALAKQQIDKPYKMGAEGPNMYDCSGLVWYCFSTLGLVDLIGGGRHRANWYYNWFKDNNQFTTERAQAGNGDLVVYGYPNGVTHIGFYLGEAARRPLISALMNPLGVSRTWMRLLNEQGKPLPIVGYLKVNYTV